MSDGIGAPPEAGSPPVDGQGTDGVASVPISVVLPAYDEEAGLRQTLDAVCAVLARSRRVHEVIVVNDGSTDATPRVLADRSDITVVNHGENRGYGAALKAGIRAARHPLIVVMDADGTYPAAAIPSLVNRCAAADMVVGARVGRNVHATPARAVVKWFFRQFAQWITGTRIPDLNSGLRAFHRTVAEQLMFVLPDGFSFTTTITVASLLEQHAVIGFEAVDYMPRIGRSKVRPLRDTTRIARQLLRLGVRFAPWRTALALALPLILLGGALAAYHAIWSGHVTAIDLAVPAAVLLMLGLGWTAEQRVRRRRGLDAGRLLAARGSLRA